MSVNKCVVLYFLSLIFATVAFKSPLLKSENAWYGGGFIKRGLLHFLFHRLLSTLGNTLIPL